jgi:signal peptide peptidase SppA
MNYLALVADRVIGRPLLILPAKAELIVSILGARIGVEGELSEDDPELAAAIGKPAANRFVGEPGGPTDNRGRRRVMYAQQDGVAIINVLGSLVNRGAWLGAYSGMTSYEGLATQVDAAASDPSVRAILLDIDSPGGEATGAFGFYETLRAARQRKPVAAVVNDLAASAAYGIAAQADEIVVSSSSITGSIGVVMVHMDVSKELERRGRKPTLIFAGAHKVDGNSLEPLSDGVRADLQRDVDAFYDRFVESVAAGRPALPDAAIRATQARTFIGAAAIEIGLADRVGSFSETLSRLSRSNYGGSYMNTRMENPGDPRVYSQAEHDAAIIAARGAERTELQAQHDAAIVAAVAAARATVLARVRGILTAEAAKGREPQALMLALDTELTVEQSVSLMEKTPAAAEAKGIPSVASRSAPPVGSDTDPKPDPTAGWEAAIAKANRMTGAKSRAA